MQLIHNLVGSNDGVIDLVRLVWCAETFGGYFGRIPAFICLVNVLHIPISS